MKRREIIKCTAALTGAALGAPLISSILSGCENRVASPSGFLDANRFDFITTLTDIILPKTDSPSATEVGVHNMIDTMVGEVYSTEDQNTYMAQLNSLIEHLGTDFKSKNTEEQLAELRAIETSDDARLQSAKSSFKEIKQQTIAYYLSTEVVGTQYLNYLPVPGEYEGCIELSSVNGKAWAI